MANKLKINRSKLKSITLDQKKQLSKLGNDDSFESKDPTMPRYKAAEDHRNELNSQLLDKLLIRKLEGTDIATNVNENNKMRISSQI